VSHQRLFLSQYGQCVLTNPCVTCGSGFVDDFWLGNDSILLDYFWLNNDSTGDVCGQESRHHLWKYFHWWFLSLQVLCTLSNQRVTFGIGFIDDFLLGSDLVFVYYFLVNRGCVRCRIQASPLQAVSLKISESAATQFLLTISESTGALCSDESKHHLLQRFRWWFLSRQRLNFHWLFLIQ
jgi:hypothetical protein